MPMAGSKVISYIHSILSSELNLQCNKQTKINVQLQVHLVEYCDTLSKKLYCYWVDTEDMLTYTDSRRGYSSNSCSSQVLPSAILGAMKRLLTF